MGLTVRTLQTVFGALEFAFKNGNLNAFSPREQETMMHVLSTAASSAIRNAIDAINNHRPVYNRDKQLFCTCKTNHINRTSKTGQH